MSQAILEAVAEAQEASLRFPRESRPFEFLIQCLANEIGQKELTLVEFLYTDRYNVLAHQGTALKKQAGCSLPLTSPQGDLLGELWFSNPVLLTAGQVLTTKPLFSTICLLLQNRRDHRAAEEAQKTLIEGAKFSALGVMAAGIAHEINNPLAIIHAYAEVLEDVEKLTAEKAEKCRMAILKSVDRISKIIRGMRKVARDGELDPFEAVTVRSIVDEILSYTQESLLHRGIDLQVEIDDRLVVICQPVQISQVILNLLSNAADATAGRTEKWIRFEAKTRDGMAILKFVDSGAGVPAELSEKIFEPFFTTKRVGQGTGLGLSISRSIVENHKGRFYLDRKENHTTFVIELPTPAVQEKSA